MKLWFENSYGKERIISEQCNTFAEVSRAIGDFIEECNRKWPHKKPFEWYYTRYWQQKDGRTRIDIGSHSEFFIWEGKVASITMKEYGECEMEYCTNE